MYHHRGCISIYWTLSYPLISLVCMYMCMRESKIIIAKYILGFLFTKYFVKICGFRREGWDIGLWIMLVLILYKNIILFWLTIVGEGCSEDVTPLRLTPQWQISMHATAFCPSTVYWINGESRLMWWRWE